MKTIKDNKIAINTKASNNDCQDCENVKDLGKNGSMEFIPDNSFI